MTSSDNHTTPAPQYSSRNTGVLAPQAVASLSEAVIADSLSLIHI